ncbi:Protein TIFY 3B [Hibiscus syriacus]|uniref:Protein TIFY 3B n=1 Tax=Hibiscus syriacus TaxID=106335 RepID=A0A6A3BPA6_HIBSY|nr:Protein TIFY 3B [Hibiscus syriacus]
MPVESMTTPSGAWDWEKLNECVPWAICARIVVICPLVLGLGDDLPGWRWEVNHSFSVKSAYKALLPATLPVSPISWGKVLLLPVPQRIRVLLWLSLHGRLLTNEERQRHHIATSACYPLCLSEDEDMSHALRRCSFALGDLVWENFRSMQWKEPGFLQSCAGGFERGVMLLASFVKSDGLSENLSLVDFYQMQEIMLIATTATTDGATTLASPQAQLYPRTRASRCKLHVEVPFARRHSLQRFLEKRRDRLVNKNPYPSPSMPKMGDDAKANLSAATSPESALGSLMMGVAIHFSFPVPPWAPSMFPKPGHTLI